MAPPAYVPVSTSDDADADADSPGKSQSRTGTAAPSSHMATTTLKVGGMTCGACTSAVEGGFRGVDGVGSVSVSLVMERAVVVHDPTILSAEQVRDTIEDCGFDAEVLASDVAVEEEDDVEETEVAYNDSEDEIDGQTEGDGGLQISTTTVSVGGMTCGACTSAVEGAFRNVAGLKSFSISLLSERAVVEHDAVALSPERIAEMIEDAGFDASIVDTHVSPPAPRQKTGRMSKSKPKSGRSRGSGKAKSLVTTTVAVEGMTCGACTSAVESGFKDLPGLVHFNISLLAERAVIVHDIEKLSAGRIAEIIEDRGFDAKILSSVNEGLQKTASSSRVQLKLYGLTDAKCASELERSIQALPGVDSISINFNTSRATISHRSLTTGLRVIVEAIEAAGYNALVADSEDNNAQLESLAKTKEIQEWRRAFRISLSFAIPVFLTSMVLPMCFPMLDYGSCMLPIPGLWLGDVVCLILTIPVQFGIGKRFYISAFKSLRHGSPTMDVLVVLGTSAAFFFSVAAMIVSMVSPSHSRPSTVFDTSTMLITFITLGRYLENRAKGQTSKALSRLMSLAPSMATIYADPIAAAKAAEAWNTASAGEKSTDDSKTSNGVPAEEKVIPTELIEVGDVVLLKPGDKIPADGTVTRGESYVDESMVTGEAMPILKRKGHHLMAGTVNGAGRVDFVVTRAGRDTQLSQIVRLVQEAQTSRAPIQRMADLVAGYFVPVIISLGLITFIGWMILSHVLPDPPKVFQDDSSGGKFMVCLKLCISVIVFACPCALGLSTPTAVMVGTGVGAESGILIKGGAALETATKITHVVLDKTGTLTVGKMSVSDVAMPAAWKLTDDSRRLWWTIVGLAEMGSEHPIARSIASTAKDRLGLGSDGALDGSVGDFEVVVGKGVNATVEPACSRERKRYRVVIGNASHLRTQGIAVPASNDIEIDDENDGFDPQPTAANHRPSSAESAKSPTPSTAETTIHIAIDSTYAGSLSLSDRLKPTARAAILALRRLNLTPLIVTGDQRGAALAIAAQLSIPPSHVHSSAPPSKKQSIITALQSSGALVAMVGDGINDSPALATAALGVALASGTDVAMEAASVVLMRADDLLAVPAALHLARTIIRRIRLNLLWATVYNLVGIPFAMGVFLPWGYSLHPMAAGAAMACSSVSVVLSSLALRWWGRPRWMSVARLDPDAVGDAAEALADDAAASGTKRGRGVGVLGWASGAIRCAGNLVRGRKTDDAGYVPLQSIGDV